MRIKDFEDTLKTHPNVLSFKLAHDLKDRLVYSYTYRVGNIVYEGTATIYVVNRDRSDEEIYFIGGLPPFITPEPHILEKKRDEIMRICNLDLIENYVVNTIGNFAVITGYKLVGNIYVMKTFIATIKDDKISVYEKA